MKVLPSRAVIPSVDARAADLGTALGDLVDCPRLGGLVAAELGVGTAGMYATACGTAMIAIAARIDTELEAIGTVPLHLDVAWTATGLDLDGDGTMDTIHDGAWIGQPGSSFVVSGGTFSGTR